MMMSGGQDSSVARTEPPARFPSHPYQKAGDLNGEPAPADTQRHPGLSCTHWQGARQAQRF